MTNEYKFSILEYTPIDSDTKKQIVIPTIQDISITDTNTVLSKPTITGQTVSQTSTRKPTTVVISILLQTDQPTYTYLEQEFTTKELLNDLRALSDSTLIFDLITTNTNLNNSLSDLVILSKSFSQSATRRNSIICTLNCTEIRFAEIGWNLVPKAEVLGVDVTIEEDAEQIIPLAMNMQIDGESKFEYSKYLTILNSKPPSITGEFITSKRGWSNIPPYYLALSTPIDLTNTETTYLIDTSFKLAVWGEYIDNEIGTKGEQIVDYANFGTIRIRVYSEGIVEFKNAQYTVSADYPTSVLDKSTLEMQYNVINQYTGFNITETFNKFIKRSDLRHEIGLKYANGFYTELSELTLTGNISSENLVIRPDYIHPDGTRNTFNVLAKPIAEKYKFTISNPDTDTSHINGTANSYKLYESELNTLTIPELDGFPIAYGDFLTPENLKGYLYAVVVGTNLYLFIFSVDVFIDAVLPGVKSI
jgi:hypothetical protein